MGLFYGHEIPSRLARFETTMRLIGARRRHAFGRKRWSRVRAARGRRKTSGDDGETGLCPPADSGGDHRVRRRNTPYAVSGGRQRQHPVRAAPIAADQTVQTNRGRPLPLRCARSGR